MVAMDSRPSIGRPTGSAVAVRSKSIKVHKLQTDPREEISPMVSQRFTVSDRCAVWLARVLEAVMVLGLIEPEKARAGLVYNGTTNSQIAFGASPIGVGNGFLQWGHNNVTGLNDILDSPGGAFGVANNALGNNVAITALQNYGPGSFQYLNWLGGNAPLSGAPFGAGSAAIYGPLATFALTDRAPGGGGTESYGFETWNSHYTQTTNYTGTFGTYLSIGGFLPIVGSSAIAGLQSEVTFTRLGVSTTYILAPEVLAIGNTGGGTFTYVALGGGPYGGAGVAFNPFTGGFSGLSIDSYSANILAGTSISITSTLAVYADPAMISTSLPDLSLTPGLSLPGESLAQTAAPEPSTVVLGGTALLVLSIVSWVRRRRRPA
jgi:hypothetical protein